MHCTLLVYVIHKSQGTCKKVKIYYCLVHSVWGGHFYVEQRLMAKW